jgi:hypothetical protein
MKGEPAFPTHSLRLRPRPAGQSGRHLTAESAQTSVLGSAHSSPHDFTRQPFPLVLFFFNRGKVASAASARPSHTCRVATYLRTHATVRNAPAGVCKQAACNLNNPGEGVASCGAGRTTWTSSAV